MASILQDSLLTVVYDPHFKHHVPLGIISFFTPNALLLSLWYSVYQTVCFTRISIFVLNSEALRKGKDQTDYMKSEKSASLLEVVEVRNKVETIVQANLIYLER